MEGLLPCDKVAIKPHPVGDTLHEDNYALPSDFGSVTRLTADLWISRNGNKLAGNLIGISDAESRNQTDP